MKEETVKNALKASLPLSLLVMALAQPAHAGNCPTVVAADDRSPIQHTAMGTSNAGVAAPAKSDSPQPVVWAQQDKPAVNQQRIMHARAEADARAREAQLARAAANCN